MNSLAQHASQMLGMEDRSGHHKSSTTTNLANNNNNNPTVLPSLFRPQPPPPPVELRPQGHHGGLFLPHLTLSATAVPGGVVPTAQQLYAALLDIQLAAASHTHSSSSSHNNSSTTTTTTTTTSSAILLPPGALSSQLAAQLSQAVGSSSSPKSSLSAAKRNINHGHRSLAGKLGCGARKHTTATTSHAPTAAPQSTSKPSSKRGKKTSGRVCAECRTDNTLQWRLGPDGQASLCNACGQRFQRRKQAMAQNSNNGNQQQQQQQHHHKSEPHSPVTSSSPASSPPSNHNHNHHVKREPVESPTLAGGGGCGERRSDIYSLLN